MVVVAGLFAARVLPVAAVDQDRPAVVADRDNNANQNNVWTANFLAKRQDAFEQNNFPIAH